MIRVQETTVGLLLLVGRNPTGYQTVKKDEQGEVQRILVAINNDFSRGTRFEVFVVTPSGRYDEKLSGIAPFAFYDDTIRRELDHAEDDDDDNL